MQMLRAAPFWLLAFPACAVKSSTRGWTLRGSNIGSTSSEGSTCPEGLLGTNCPQDDVWLDELLKIDDLSAPKVLIDVGCNKATNLVRLMERYDHTGNISSKALLEAWATKNVNNFACSEPGPPGVTVQSLGKQLPGPPRTKGICVEPVQSTVEALTSISADLGLTNVGFQLVQAAMIKSATPGQTLSFPNARPGEETLGVGPAHADLPRVNVSAMTVDGLVAKIDAKQVDFLHIDVEGFDPDVLAGAKQTLQVTRYVAFEVHRDLKDTTWSHTTLRSVIESLSQADFDCYWTTNQGLLINVEACWKDAFEHSGWSNIACVKRSDPWGSVMKQLSGL